MCIWLAVPMQGCPAQRCRGPREGSLCTVMSRGRRVRPLVPAEGCPSRCRRGTGILGDWAWGWMSSRCECLPLRLLSVPSVASSVWLWASSGAGSCILMREGGTCVILCQRDASCCAVGTGGQAGPRLFSSEGVRRPGTTGQRWSSPCWVPGPTLLGSGRLFRTPKSFYLVLKHQDLALGAVQAEKVLNDEFISKQQ